MRLEKGLQSWRRNKFQKKDGYLTCRERPACEAKWEEKYDHHHDDHDRIFRGSGSGGAPGAPRHGARGTERVALSRRRGEMHRGRGGV